MKRATGLLLAAVAVLVFASACTRPTAPEPIPEVPAPSEGKGAAAWPEWAFPTKAVEITYRFDDGTPETNEQLVPLGDRVAAVKEDRVYVTWFVQPDGVYRQDPLGGKDAPLLRYLPAVPQHGLVWSQTSGDTRVWFRLQEAPGCGEDYSGEKLTGSCWDLHVLNRGEVHFFRFAKEAGVIQAGVLSPTRPQKSFQKRAKVRPWPAVTGKADLERWAGSAAVWASDKAAAYTAETAAKFEQHLPDLSGFGRQIGSTRVFATWGEWTGQGLLTVRTPYDWAWLPCLGPSCRHTWVPGPEPIALTEARHKGDASPSISGQMARPDGGLHYVYGFEPKIESTIGEVAAVDDGQITIRHVLDDPAGHTETRVYRVVQGEGVERVSTDLIPTTGELKYPDTPENVLLAAFVAKYYGETDELPRYFASPEVAEAFGKQELSPSPYGYRGLYRLGLGRVEPYAGDNFASHPPTVTLHRSPLGEDGRTGFMLDIAYYEGGPRIWGQIRFIQQQGLWQIAEFTIEGDEFVY